MCYFRSRSRMPISDGTRDYRLETSAIGPVPCRHLAPHGEQRGNGLNSGAFLSLVGLFAVLTLGGVIDLSERAVVEDTEHNWECRPCEFRLGYWWSMTTPRT